MRSERFYAENFRSHPGKMIAFVVYETGEVTAALADRARLSLSEFFPRGDDVSSGDTVDLSPLQLLEEAAHDTAVPTLIIIF